MLRFPELKGLTSDCLCICHHPDLQSPFKSCECCRKFEKSELAKEYELFS